MRMNSGIILQGQQPDLIGSAARGFTAGRQNALAGLYKEHGQGIASGDQNALNALAQFDPNEAIRAQAGRQAINHGKERMGFDREKMEILRTNARNAAADRVAAMDAAAAAAEKERLTGLIQAGAMFFQNGDKEGYEAFASQNGVDVNQYPFEALPANLASLIGVTDALDAIGGPKPADEYGRYVAEERAAGREPLSRIEYKRAGLSKSSIEVGADGSVSISENGGGSEGNKGGPLSAGGFIDAIDGALNDEALDWSTGMLNWTQVLPGTPMARFKTRVDQLSGQAFMQARQALKGGGQITDYEGQRAEAAIGRLSDAQSPDDYRQALVELRQILAQGMLRERGWVDTSVGKIHGMGARELESLNFKDLSQDEIAAVRTRLNQIINLEGE